MRWFLLLGVAACSSSEPAPPAPAGPATSGAPVPPKPPPAVAPTCTAEALGIKHGPEIGEYSGSFLGNNTLKLHLAQLEGTAPGEPPKPGVTFVAWGEIKLTNVEPLFELTDVPDPGTLCVATLTAAGQPRAGKLVAGNRPGNFPELTVTGRLPADAATALWGASSLAATGGVEKLVPGFDTRPDGASYVLVHLGDLGPQGNPVELMLDRHLFGEVSLAIVNEKGKAIQHLVHVQ